MTESKASTTYLYDADTFSDSAFDPQNLMTPFWIDNFAKARVELGRHLSAAPKSSTTLHLDPDVLERFKADVPGWQGSINAALCKAVGLSAARCPMQ